MDADLHEPDLLAEAEAAAFLAVRRAPQAAPQAAPVVASAPELVWEERDDVYRPHRGEAQAFAKSLGAAWAPGLEQAEVQVCVTRSAMLAMRTHLASNTSVELGGLLVGSVCQDIHSQSYVTAILRAIPASAGVGTPTTFAYTTQAWTNLAPQLQDLPPEWTVVGSYHSHPNMGVFLSSTDLATQESVFAQLWQVAIVIDPIRDQFGLFAGPGGKPCDRWSLVEG